MENVPEKTRVVLLDIIGTTTPYSFSRVTLPEYAIEHMLEFLRRFRSVPEIKSNLADLKRMHSEDVRAGENPPPWDADDLESDLTCILDYCNWLIEMESSAPPLKYIEDFIWEEGYRSGQLRGEVYPDVPDALAKLKSLNLDICTYSSGSVFSQQLIFATTKYGDLMTLFRGFFDTSVGDKDEPESYRKIAEILGVEPSEILYFSSSPDEVMAARKAGLNVVLMEREHSLGIHGEDLRTMKDFTTFTTMELG